MDGCKHGNVRLAGGATDREGRVEVCILGRWGTICDRNWQKANAQVVCQQLGFDLETYGKQSTLKCFTILSGMASHYYSRNNIFPSDAHAITDASFGGGSGIIYLQRIICTGDEPGLLNCSGAAFGIQSCDHSDDVGVVCAGKGITLDKPSRIVHRS